MQSKVHQKCNLHLIFKSMLHLTVKNYQNMLMRFGSIERAVPASVFLRRSPVQTVQ